MHLKGNYHAEIRLPRSAVVARPRARARWLWPDAGRKRRQLHDARGDDEPGKLRPREPDGLGGHDSEVHRPSISLVAAGIRADAADSGPSALTDGNSLHVSPGETKEVEFDTPGTYKITCTLHPMMNLTITVQ